MKSQAAVTLDERVAAVSESVSGSTGNLALLEQIGVVEPLDPDEATGASKAYAGAEEPFPGTAYYVPIKKPRGGEPTPEETSYNKSLRSPQCAPGSSTSSSA